MAQAPRQLSPTESPHAFFGAELRFWRTLRGLSLDRLGRRVHVSGDLLSKVEKAIRWPTADLAADCDTALQTNGALSRLFDLVETQRVDRRTRAGNQPQHADNNSDLYQLSPVAGTMNVQVDEEGNVWADIDRRRFLIGSASTVMATAMGSDPIAAVPAARPSDDPFGFTQAVTNNWPGVSFSRPAPGLGIDWAMLLPGGRAMRGAESALQLHPARLDGKRVILSMPDRQRTTDFLGRPGRGALVGAVIDGDHTRFFLVDGRHARSAVGTSDGMLELVASTAYELDDFTFGILWAVANYDEALQADDRELADAQADLKSYERLSASAVSKEAAPGLNDVAHMWLGSDFCARHILRALPQLPELPSFWTREQRGEEASAWLVFDHKYPYLRDTTKALGGNATTRAFCVPEHVVRASPRHERVLLFLAVALMEMLGIQAHFTADTQYEPVEGFVVAPNKQAIIANWVRGDGMWHVDLTDRASIVREFTNVADDVGAESIIAGPTAAARLRALANYLELPWSWLVQRSAAVGRYGSSRLIQSRSRMLSPAGLDAACAYVGGLPADS